MFDHEMECKNSFCQLKENCIFKENCVFEDCPYRKSKNPKAEELVLFLMKKTFECKTKSDGKNEVEKKDG